MAILRQLGEDRFLVKKNSNHHGRIYNFRGLKNLIAGEVRKGKLILIPEPNTNQGIVELIEKTQNEYLAEKNKISLDEQKRLARKAQQEYYQRLTEIYR